jgi:hypothetical protein
LGHDIFQLEDALLKGHIPANSLYDFAKDEIVALKKIYDVKTRSITNSNLAFSILYRMYFSDFEAFMHTTGATGAWWYMVGINPDSLSWEQFYMRLRSTSAMGWDFDVSRWDGSFTQQLYDACVSIINHFYNDGYDIVRTSIAMNALFGYVQCADMVYEPSRGMPSGFAGTTTFNTLGHYVLIYTLYLMLCEKNNCMHLSSYYYFCLYVALGLYGDDLTLTVSREISLWFNGNELAKMYGQHGWKVTMADGKAELLPDTPLMITGKYVHDLTFLQRGFSRHPEIGYMTAPLRMSSIKDLAYWIKKSTSPREQFYENLHNSVFMMFSHGKKNYDSWLDDINSALSTIGYTTIDFTFDDVLQIMLSRVYNI